MLLTTLKQHPLATKTLQATGPDRLTDYICLNPDNSLGDKAKMIRRCLAALGFAARDAGNDFIPLLCGKGFQNPRAADSVPCAARAGSLTEMAAYIQ